MGAYDDDIDSMDDGLRRLKIEYDVFFNGNRKRPPEDLRARVERIVRRLSEAADMSYSQRFRYTTLVTRLYVYKDLWRRTMLERERGLAKAHGPEPPTQTKPAGTGGPRQEMFRIAIMNQTGDSEKIRQLYDKLLELNSNGAASVPKLSLEKFTEFIESRAAGIRGKYHCSSVEFSISVESESVRFTAKPGQPPAV